MGWGFKNLNFNFWSVIAKLDCIFRSFLCILGYFHKVKVQKGNMFWGLLKFKIVTRYALYF